MFSTTEAGRATPATVAGQPQAVGPRALGGRFVTPSGQAWARAALLWTCLRTSPMGSRDPLPSLPGSGGASLQGVCHAQVRGLSAGWAVQRVPHAGRGPQPQAQPSALRLCSGPIRAAAPGQLTLLLSALQGTLCLGVCRPSLSRIHSSGPCFLLAPPLPPPGRFSAGMQRWVLPG